MHIPVLTCLEYVLVMWTCLLCCLDLLLHLEDCNLIWLLSWYVAGQLREADWLVGLGYSCHGSRSYHTLLDHVGPFLIMLYHLKPTLTILDHFGHFFVHFRQF